MFIEVLFYILFVLYILVVVFLSIKKTIERRIKWFAAFVLLACFISVGGYIWVRVEEHHAEYVRVQMARFFGHNNFGYEAANQVMEYLAPGFNPITGEVFEQFLFPPDLSAPITVPQFAAPYQSFAFMLRGYKTGNVFHYTSPWLNEANIPKKLIEESVIHYPLGDVKSPRYLLDTRILVRNDTVYFRTVVTDCDLRDSVLPQLVELGLRFNNYRDYFYAKNPYIKTVGGPTYHVLVAHHGKTLYRNNAFDTSKVFLANRDEYRAPKDLKILVYSDNDPKLYEKEFQVGSDELLKEEWALLAGFILSLILLLRGSSLLNAIARKKQE